MNSAIRLLLLIALYTLFSIVLFCIFHNMISIIIAGIAAALVGIALSGGKV